MKVKTRGEKIKDIKNQIKYLHEKIESLVNDLYLLTYDEAWGKGKDEERNIKTI